MLKILLYLAAANAVLAIPMMLIWRRDFATRGRTSLFSAVLSGVVMYGYGILTFAVAWVDRGALGPLSPAATYAGAALVIIGAAIIFAGRYAYASRARVFGMLEDKLIEQGVYRWSRNPQYFGYTAMMFGAAFAALSAWALLLAMAFAVMVHIHIVGVEEPHLRRVFGKAYETYCARVARYFGRPKSA